jgi:hypothetical protein
MHTLKVLAAGLVLLAVCLFIGRGLASGSPVEGLATGVKVFIPLWFVGAAINLWVGVTRAGYTVAEEAPVFALVFAVPVATALVVWWLAARASA